MNKYKLQITGYNTKYFLNTLISKKIKLYRIKQSKNTLIITVDRSDYLKILDIKTTCKIKILNRFGIVKYKYLIYKYRYSLLFFILSIFLLVFLSNIIFSIEVIHSKDSIRQLLYDDLEMFGLKRYGFVISYNKKENIKRKIEEKEKDKIEWMEIDRVGTKYIINVEEKKIKKEVKDDKPRNIVAKKSSMILSIESDNGEIVKKKYDYVLKGDIIISGTIMNKDREVKKIKANGKVYGEVWYKASVSIPTNYKEIKLTGNKKKVLSLFFLDKEYSLELRKYRNYSFNEIKLFYNNILPIKLVILDKKEEKVTTKKYNINNIDKKAFSLVDAKFKNKEILSQKVLKKTLNKSTIVVDIFLKVKEDITDYEEITDLELKEDINE